jgi:integrase/recombinase XerD
VLGSLSGERIYPERICESASKRHRTGKPLEIILANGCDEYRVVEGVSQRFGQLDKREKQVVRLWQSGHISPGSILLYLQWVRRYYAYCQLHHLDEAAELTLDGARRFTQAYVGPRTKGRVGAGSCLVAKNALHAWAFALRTLGATLPEWSPVAPVRMSPLLAEYCQFRRCHRGVAEGTLQRDAEDMRTFLSLLRKRGKPVGRLTVADLDAFVQEQAEHVSRRTVARACTALRSFLRFLRSTGRLRRDLATCVMAPRVRMAESPPRILPWADVQRILRSIPQAEPPGKRDFAMLSMLALYGLGAAEVLALQLENVDWKSEVIYVRRPKTGIRIKLPLLPAVARALSAYLQSERPPCAQTRRIFVSSTIPYEPLTSAAIRHQIRRYARQAGVTARVIGAHAFRHTHASRQIDAGASLKVVSDILGHRQPSSTSVYVRVALRRLRGVTLPVPK